MVLVALILGALSAVTSPSAAQSAGSPVGHLDTVAPVPGAQVRAVGWALDPDGAALNYQAAVAVFVDGELVAYDPLADNSRPDVAAAYPGTGDLHGFDIVFSAGPGVHEVCAAALNAPDTGGEDQIIGCHTITTGSPIGPIDALQFFEAGASHLVGWAIDPDTADSIAVAVFANGELVGYDPAANVDRPDVDAAYPGYGPFHGYDIPVILPGTPTELCVAAINAPGTGGADSVLGCVTAAGDPPIGNFEELRLTPMSPRTSGLRAVGWALDLNDPTTSIPVAVFQDGQLVAYTVAGDSRPDVDAVYPGSGPAHGFDLSWAADDGVHDVCVVAQNVPGTNGGDVVLRCEQVTIAPTIGNLDVLGLSAPGMLRVRGWAIDTRTAAPAAYAIFVDGQLVAANEAASSREDVEGVYPGYGPMHGFDVFLDVSDAPHEVCVFAADSLYTPERVLSFGCATV